MKIGELLFELGFKADTMKLKDFGRAVSELNVSSVLTAGAFGAVYEGAKHLIGLADDMALGVNKFSRETGQSTQDIQKWNAMAQQMGVSAGTVASSVSTLEDNLFKMKFTGEGTNIWNMLGLDPRHTKDMFEVLSMLRSRLKNMSTEQQRFFLQNLGLSTEMLNIFKLTDQQWADIPKQQALSNEELKKMDEFHKSSQKLSHDIAIAWADIGVSLIPIAEKIIKISDNMNNIARNSKDFQNFLGFIAKAGEGAGQLLGKSAEGWGKIFQYAQYAGQQLAPESAVSMLPFTNPGIAPGMSSISKVNHVTVSAPITINSNDPETTAKIVQKHLDKQTNDAVDDRPEGSY